MNNNDIANLADCVAQAIYASTSPDETWSELTDDEQADFRLAAHAAMSAHVGWMTLNGWTMMRMEKRPRKGLIATPKSKLIGLH